MRTKAFLLLVLLVCPGGNVWAQAPAVAPATAAPAVAPAPSAPVPDPDPLIFEVVLIDNTVVGEVMTLMAKHPFFAAMTPDTVSNKISLYGPRSVVEALKVDIAKIDYPRRKVEISLSAIDSTLSANQTVGVDWSLEKLPTPLPSANGVWQVAFSGGVLGWTRSENEKTIFNLLYLQSKNMAKTLNTPRFIVTDGTNAQLFLGQEFWVKVYSGITNAASQPQSIKAGVTMDVTPRITSDGKIMIQIKKADVSEAIGSGLDGLPVVFTRNFSLSHVVENGESMIFAGLISSYEGRDRSKVPILGDIPLIGKIFQSSRKIKTERELTILLTCRIVGEEKGISPSVQKAKVVEQERAPTTTPGIESSSSPGDSAPKPDKKNTEDNPAPNPTVLPTPAATDPAAK